MNDERTVLARRSPCGIGFQIAKVEGVFQVDVVDDEQFYTVGRAPALDEAVNDALFTIEDLLNELVEYADPAHNVVLDPVKMARDIALVSSRLDPFAGLTRGHYGAAVEGLDVPTDLRKRVSMALNEDPELAWNQAVRSIAAGGGSGEQAE